MSVTLKAVICILLLQPGVSYAGSRSELEAKEDAQWAAANGFQAFTNDDGDGATDVDDALRNAEGLLGKEAKADLADLKEGNDEGEVETNGEEEGEEEGEEDEAGQDKEEHEDHDEDEDEDEGSSLDEDGDSGEEEVEEDEEGEGEEDDEDVRTRHRLVNAILNGEGGEDEADEEYEDKDQDDDENEDSSLMEDGDSGEEEVEEEDGTKDENGEEATSEDGVTENMTTSDLDDFYAKYDTDFDGKLSLPELVKELQDNDSKEKPSPELLGQAFVEADSDKDNLLSKPEMVTYSKLVQAASCPEAHKLGLHR